MALLSSRRYKSGTKWCLWRWTFTDAEYIVRLHLIKTPLFAICLHWLKKPDPEPYLHDHPVSFLSLILRGGYSELRGGYWYGKTQPFLKHNKWWNWIDGSKGVAHRIVGVKENTLTLCIMGPKTREWGFHVPEAPDGWVYWKDYNKAKYG